MRRKDREQGREFALNVLRGCEYATLATVNLDGSPYSVPISPVLVGETVYFHCALEGQKIDNIANLDKVCLSCVGYTKLVPEKFTTEYESAVATGRCTVVTDREEKIMALRGICEKYAASNMDAFEGAVTKSLARTGICKVEIEQITGKGKRISD